MIVPSTSSIFAPRYCKPRFSRPAIGEIVAAFDANHWQWCDAAFGFAHHAATDQGIGFNAGDLDANGGGELATIVGDDAIAVGQSEHGQVEFAVDTLAGFVDLIIKDNVLVDDGRSRAACIEDRSDETNDACREGR